MIAWKRLLLSAWYHGSLPARRAALWRLAAAGRAPAIVLFYHRVADTFVNDWTTPTAIFERQLDWLGEHFDLVSLSETQRRMATGRNNRPSVAITFDDGYAENCDFALPLLEARRVPVTYFVSTDHVLHGKSFPHDVEAGRPLPTNTVAQLRSLAGDRFEIGAHTRTHCDIGLVNSTRVLRDEIVTARDDLEQALGVAIRFFAFPFGQPHNLSHDAFDLARENGYAGVVSAYGGYNLPGGDPFHLRRIHGDPDMLRLKNWLTLDPRKAALVRKMDWQTARPPQGVDVEPVEVAVS